jgi:predicted transcriptional regulator
MTRGKTGPRRSDKVMDAEIGARIRARREALGISLGNLATMIGISTGTMCKYEIGALSCKISTLVVLAGALKCKACEFIAGLKAGKK